MRSCNDRFCITPGFCLVSVLMLFLLPARFTVALFLAASVHELGHYIMLRILRVSVYRICLSATGARIECDGMRPMQELLTSLAGPSAGLLFVPFRAFLPLTAIIAFMHSVFNLLPIGSLDGGRALKSILTALLGQNRGVRLYKYFNFIMSLLFAVTILWLCMLLHQFNLLILALFLLMMKQIPVKNLAKRWI